MSEPGAPRKDDRGATSPAPPAARTPPGIHRILKASHRNAEELPPTFSEAQEGSDSPRPVVADERRIREVEPPELEGVEWLPALVFHQPEGTPFPGDYAVLAQPFFAPASETGYLDARGVPLSYLVVFVTGAVGVKVELSQESIAAAFRETLRRATALAKEISVAMGNAPVRLMIARMPEWMARKIHPGFRSVRQV